MSKEDFKDYISDIQESLFDIECTTNSIDEEDMDEEGTIPDSCRYEWMHAMHYFHKMKKLIDEVASKLDEEEEDDED